MSDSILRDKAKQFARETVFFCRRWKDYGVEYVLIKQLLKSGTSVGANVHEAQYAQGEKDFISKLEIALKECNEADFWLELIGDTTDRSKQECDQMRLKCVELRRMLVSSVRTMKSKLNNE